MNQFNNSYLGMKVKSILNAFHESNDLPQKGEYDNGTDGDGNKLTGYAIDYDQIDDAFLYDNVDERDADYDKLMGILKPDSK